MIDPSAIIELSGIVASGDLMRRTDGESVGTLPSIGPGGAVNIALGARFFGFLSAHVVGERAWFSCDRSPCGASSEAFGGSVRGEVSFYGTRPFLELAALHRLLNAHVFNEYLGSGRYAPPVWTRFTGVDVRASLGVGFPLGRGAYLDFAVRASFGKFTWFSGEPNSNWDPNIPRPNGDIDPAHRTWHGLYSLGVALRFGGA